MVNAPQSSRVAGSMTRDMFPDVGAGVIKAPSYFAEKQSLKQERMIFKLNKRRKLTVYIISSVLH